MMLLLQCADNSILPPLPIGSRSSWPSSPRLSLVLLRLAFAIVAHSAVVADGANWRSWKTGDQLSDDKAHNEPLLIGKESRIVINGRAINGTVPELVKLYFDGGPGDEQRQMVMRICARRHHCTLTLCFVGQMEPGNGEHLNSQFHLQNHLKNNAIAAKCNQAQETAWKTVPNFGDKVLHGVQIERKNEHLWLTSSTSEIPDMYYVPQCADVHLGDNGILEGHLADRAPDKPELFIYRAAMRGFILSMERTTIALAFDLLAGTGQGVQIGIIGQPNGCDMDITLTGDGLAKCLGKQCAEHEP